MSDCTPPLDRLVARAGQLYSLPAVAMKVLELTENPRVDVHALKQCIENDPALTTKILRVVNSSLFGLSREVSDLNQAIALLGIKPLKLLVLGFSLPEGLFDGIAGEILGRYWRHTLVQAVAAREISETLAGQPGDEAFIAGLLQDLGTLVLIQELGEPYVRFLEKVHAEGGDLRALETDALGFDHTMLTARLLEEWTLPPALVEAVCPADGPPSASTPLPRTVHLAGLVARLLADGQPGALAELLAVGEKDHGLSREQLEHLVGILEEKVAQLADVLSLHLPDGRDYREVLLQAHRQLAEVAAEAAADLVEKPRGESGSDSGGAGLLDEFEALSQAVAEFFRTVPEPELAASAHGSAPAAVALEPSAPAPAALAARPAVANTHLRQASRSPADEADPGLLGRLGASVGACRKSHSPLTLLLVEMDDVEDLLIIYGVEGLGKLRQLVETACRGVDHPDALCLPHGDYGFAVILPDCDRQPAVQLGNQLVDGVRRLTPGGPPRGRPAVGISVGAATVSMPPKNFPPEELFNGAARCLFGSHASGGSVVKSIEIY